MNRRQFSPDGENGNGTLPTTTPPPVPPLQEDQAPQVNKPKPVKESEDAEED